MLIVSIILIVLGSTLSVVGGRFTGTRRWLLRVLATPEVPTLQFGLENAVTHRWLSLSAVAAPIVIIAGIAAAFAFAWWMGILSVIACVLLTGRIAGMQLLPRNLTWYLDRFRAHAERIRDDCVAFGEPSRIAISSDFAARLEAIHAVYLGSSVVAPTPRAAESVALGDINSLLH